MPTRRTGVILILALALYLIANQTQVGWVYIMVDALIALLLAAFIYGLGLLKGIQGQRKFLNLSTQSGNDSRLDPLFDSADFFEDDAIEVLLGFSQTRLRPAFLIAGTETCPFAPPNQRQQSFFIPRLFKNKPVSMRYTSLCHQRGVYTFPAQTVHSKGPFGLFGAKHRVDTSGEILIYPQYHPLKRMRLLENRGFTDQQALRTGQSSEVIGAREYRSGDALRRVHWRSTARSGRLVVKEFSDTDHLTITVVLDLSREAGLGQGKYSTFETAVRIAASLGYYATHKNIPFRLAGHSQQWQPPNIALSWWGVLHYLARVQNDGDKSLAQVLRNVSPAPFLVALISNPNEAIIRELVALPKKGIDTLAIVISPNDATLDSPVEVSSEGLTIKTVTPQNWASVLEEF